MSVHLLTILQSTGIAFAAAVGLGALVGPCQVAARTVEIAIARFHHPIWTKIASVSFVALGLSALWTGLPLIPLALAFYGAGIRLESIARGTLPLALFGASGYATLMGRLAMPSLLAQALGSLGRGSVAGADWRARYAGRRRKSVAALNVALSIGLAWVVFRHSSRV